MIRRYVFLAEPARRRLIVEKLVRGCTAMLGLIAGGLFLAVAVAGLFATHTSRVETLLLGGSGLAGLLGYALLVRGEFVPGQGGSRTATVLALAPVLLTVGFIVLAPPVHTSNPDRAYRSMLRSDLYNVVTLQEARYAEHGSYAAHFDQLTDHPSAGGIRSEITMLGVHDQGYVALAKTDRRDFVCTITINHERTSGIPDGMPLCH